MSKRVLLLGLILCFGNTYAKDYIGIIVPPYPSDVKSHSSTVINFSKSGEIEWSQSHVKIKGKDYLWLELFQGRKNNQAYFKIIDQTKIPSISKNYNLYLTNCENRITKERYITAIGNGDPYEEVHTNIIKAWRINFSTGKIESISTLNIICINDGWAV